MPLLEVDRLHARYQYAPILQGVSFGADAAQIVSIFGRNGAGKTTALRTIMGWLGPTDGRILFDGESIGGLSPDRIFRKGIAYIPEDRRIFATLSVQENLMLGLFMRRQSAAQQRRELDHVFDLFPRLRERRSQLGKTLSGGEQQMLAIARGLMSDPEVLIIDELSLGLAPLIVQSLAKTLVALKKAGLTILLVEQNVHLALALSDYAYVIAEGRPFAEGTSTQVADRAEIRQAYLGL